MKFSRSLARFLAITATMTTLGIAAQSFGHAVLTYPKSRDGLDGNKTGPCGTAVVTNPPINLYTVGQMMTVTWNETINHPGCFVVEWSKDNNATFTNLATIPHTTAGATPRPYLAKVNLPASSCSSCTLRVIQHMLAADNLPCPPVTPAPGSLYFSCAEMTTDPSRLPDMSMPGSSDLGSPADLAMAPDLAMGDGGTTATGCNFPGHTASSAGALMVLAAAVSLFRRRR